MSISRHHRPRIRHPPPSSTQSACSHRLPLGSRQPKPLAAEPGEDLLDPALARFRNLLLGPSLHFSQHPPQQAASALRRQCPPARDRAPRPQVRPGPHPRRRDPSAGIAQKPLAWTFPEGAARPWLELSTCACRGHLDPAPRSEVLPPRHDGPELSAPRSTAGTWLFPLAAPCV